jgi:hypothetical protein
MTVRIIECSAWGNRVGLKISGGADVQVVNSDFSGNVEAGILVSDDPGALLARLNLPPNTPLRDLGQLIAQLASMQSEPERDRIAVVRKSRLAHWLTRIGFSALNLTTLAANLSNIAVWASTPAGRLLLSKLGL